MLSVVITAWNEAKNLPRAVASVQGLADEVVVVDTESTDRTVIVARELGCRVFHHANTRIVEPVRNFSISKAAGDWVLLLDADEEVSPGLAGKIREIIAQNNVDYCRIPRQNLIFGRWIKTSHWWPDYTYRLFKKDAVTWQEKIHSIPLTRGTGYDFPVDPKLSLLHHNYDSISQYVDRMNRYTDLQSENIIASSARFYWPDLLAKPADEFLTQYFSRRGYTEGLHGLALSLLQAVSEFVVYLKVWQASGFPAHPVSASDLNCTVYQISSRYQWWVYEFRINSTNLSLKKLYWKTLRRLSSLSFRS